MKCKRQKLLFTFESCPFILIFCFLVIKRIHYFIVLNDELTIYIWNTHVGFCVVFYYRIKSYRTTTYTNKTLYFLRIFIAKPSNNTSTKRMINKYDLIILILINDFVDLLTSVIHRN